MFMALLLYIEKNKVFNDLVFMNGQLVGHSFVPKQVFNDLQFGKMDNFIGHFQRCALDAPPS